MRETCLLNGQMNSRKAGGTQTQSRLEVIENILWKHFVLSLYPPTERNTQSIRAFSEGRIRIEKSASATNDEGTSQQNPENQDGHLQRATKFGDIITADHKFPNEKRGLDCSIVKLVWYKVAAQWLQSYPCKTKTSQTL